jgi:hypothetical protein
MKLIHRLPMTYAHRTINITACLFRIPVLARFEISTRNFLMFRRRALTPSAGLRPFYFKEGSCAI